MRNNKNKIVMIVALCVAVFGLSLGFATFSNSLTVSSSAEVKADPDNFKVEFSTVIGENTEGEIVPSLIGTPTASNAIIKNGDVPTISNIRISFEEMVDSVTYEFYVTNTGDYDAYLKKIYTSNASDSTSYKTCKALPGTSQESVDSVCDLITVTVSGLGGSYTLSNEAFSSDFVMTPGASVLVRLNINYGWSSEVFADGDFIVEFGDIGIEFSSVAG